MLFIYFEMQSLFKEKIILCCALQLLILNLQQLLKMINFCGFDFDVIFDKKFNRKCMNVTMTTRVSAIFADLSPYHFGRPITPLIDIPKYFSSNMPLEVA